MYRTLKKELKAKKDHIKKKYDPIYLTNEDFKNGSYIIDKSGYYKLSEDIVFNPNSDQDYFPTSDQEKYQTLGFSLGFFAAIIIQTENVYLDLNCYEISQGVEHALQQRFFSVIELASAPFILPQGPGNFGEVITSKNIIISNGTIGLSSHQGIHGNGADKVMLTNLKIVNFEVAGISLNGSSNVVMERIKIKNSRTDVPVLATYSAARFARMFAKSLLLDPRLSDSQRSMLSGRLELLQREMNIAYDEIIKTGETQVELFRNDSQLPDGTVYGVLAHSKGVAVDDFDAPGVTKVENIFLKHIHIKNLNSNAKEIVGLSGKDGKGCQIDVAGAVFQIDNLCHPNGIYKSTTLADLQLGLAEISYDLDIQLGKTNITLDTIEWAKSKRPISYLLDMGYKYKCSCDAMFHLSKELIGLRFGGIDNLMVRKCKVEKIMNHSRLGNDVLDGNYLTSHDNQKTPGYNGAGIIGCNISYCSRTDIYKSRFHDIKSKNGNAIGIRVMNESDIVKVNCVDIIKVWAGTLCHGLWMGEDYYGNQVEYNGELPNCLPCAIGIKIGKSIRKIKVKNAHLTELSGPCEIPIKK